MNETQEYYDDFVAKQLNTGINSRHRSIRRWLREFGLKSNHRVLEIGCGIGTQTELLLKDVGADGHVTAMDISPKSIETARGRLGSRENLELIAADATNYDFSMTFDMIVMPDVIEHIPIELHGKLFGKLSSVLSDEGRIIIHIPNPYYLEWVRDNRPELLQLIDQPIFTNLLVESTYPHGLYIHTLRTYSIWADPADYQVIELRRIHGSRNYEIRPVSWARKAISLPRRLARKILVRISG